MSISCGTAVVVLYFAYGLAVVYVESRLRPHLKDLSKPLRESDISSIDGRRWWRRDRLLTRLSMPIWILGLSAMWFFCKS